MIPQLLFECYIICVCVYCKSQTTWSVFPSVFTGPLLGVSRAYHRVHRGTLVPRALEARRFSRCLEWPDISAQDIWPLQTPRKALRFKRSGCVRETPTKDAMKAAARKRTAVPFSERPRRAGISGPSQDRANCRAVSTRWTHLQF